MLAWDDHITPNTPARRPANQPRPVAAPAATQPAADRRRVNVADKRIINGKTDVNQLVPFKYK
jgi:ribonucleoside-diphosphate reductase beta chain